MNSEGSDRIKTLCEMSLEGFSHLVDEIMALGYDEETAAEYASHIGCIIEMDEQGRVVVRDDAGRELARLKLRSFMDGKYELAFYRAGGLIDTWSSETPLDFVLQTGTVQMPWWPAPAAIDRTEKQIEYSKDGRSFLERTIVHLKCSKSPAS